LPSIADRSLNIYDIWKLGYSPINLNELYIALEKYPSKDIAKLLRDVFTSGVKINYTGSRLPLDKNNLKSALQYPVVAFEKVENRISLGGIGDLLSSVQFQI
jgi:hypothetical protein